MVGYGLVVVVVLWLWRQLVVVVVIIGWLWWLFVGLLWIFFFLRWCCGCGFAPVVAVGVVAAMVVVGLFDLGWVLRFVNVVGCSGFFFFWFFFFF